MSSMGGNLSVRLGIAFSTETLDETHSIIEDVGEAITVTMQKHGYDSTQDFVIAVAIAEDDDDDE